MSGLTVIAIAGAGHIGKFLAKEFLRLKATGVVTTVKVLTRTISAESDDNKELKELGAEIVPVDYSNPSSLTSALSHVDVVISGFGYVGFKAQDDLAIASKEAGVKLFVPSEFGTDNSNLKETDFMWGKVAILSKLKEIGLPYTLFWCGLWPDFIFLAPVFGWDFANARATIYGKGDAPISYAARPDVARFVGHVLTTLPLEKLEWATIRFEAERMSWNELAEAWQAKSGRKLEITRLPLGALEERKKNPADFAASLLLAMELGKSIVGQVSQLNNDLYSDWKPTKVVDVLLA